MAVQVVCTTLLIEKSPQALPLGAACIATAIKHRQELRGLCEVSLTAFCLEDKDFPKDKKSASEYIADKLTEKTSGCDKAIFCFSCFVWNVGILEAAAKRLREKGFVCIAGGPEITAHPDFYKAFNYTVSGEGEITVPNLISKIINKENETHKVIISQSPDLTSLNSPYLDGIINPSEY